MVDKRRHRPRTPSATDVAHTRRSRHRHLPGRCRRRGPVAHRLERLDRFDGDLTPWDGAPVTANNLWVTDQPGNPWRLDLTVGGGDDAFWWYRRDPSVRLPWSEAVIETSDGVAYLAPHIQLLFKAKAPRTKDDVDLRQVAPHLTARQRDWLAQRLAADHP